MLGMGQFYCQSRGTMHHITPEGVVILCRQLMSLAFAKTQNKNKSKKGLPTNKHLIAQRDVQNVPVRLPLSAGSRKDLRLRSVLALASVKGMYGGVKEARVFGSAQHVLGAVTVVDVEIHHCHTSHVSSEQATEGAPGG